jgi:hypothetical protein
MAVSAMLQSGMVKRTLASRARKIPLRFTFSVPLVKLGKGGTAYVLQVPERVTSAIGRRGPVPIVATLAARRETAEIQASLVPMGGGRHWLQLNARVRGELGIKPGDPVRVSLSVPEKPPTLPLPAELALALKEADLRESFSAFPVGKQNHLILWIEEAVRPETREKRVAQTIEVVFRARERAYDQKNAGKLANFTDRRRGDL